MEAVKWNLDVVNKITIYTDSKEIVYTRENEKWSGAGISIGTKTMKILMENYERAGCIVIPEVSVYIPTDTRVIEVGRWAACGDKYEFDRLNLIKKHFNGWVSEYGTVRTNVDILRYLKRKVKEGCVIRYLNQKLDIIGYND